MKPANIGFDAECQRYVEDVGRVLEAALRHALTGVYLHGSAAMTGFVPSRSDIDMLAVVKRPLVVAEKASVAASLSEEALPCPARQLEFSVVTRDVAATVTPSPRYELHISTGDDPHWIDGSGREGDPDLVAHFAMTRARGLAVLGPRPEQVFGEVSRDLLLGVLLSDLEWAESNAPAEYRVLNACRCWRLVEEGVLGAKVEAGDWALRRGAAPSVVKAALARQAGDEAPIDEERLSVMVAGVERLVREALAQQER